MTTYFSDSHPQREKYAHKAVGSLLEHLHCESGLYLHIADDSEQINPTTRDLMKQAHSEWEVSSTYSNSGHRGIGASLNCALNGLPVNEWMYTTDDWVLTDFLDLDVPIRLLHSGYDLVRLGPIHPDLQCVTRFQAGLGWWLDLNPHYGGFCFATRPFIATKAFYAKVGPFDEQLNSYETERLYAQKVANSTCKLAYWGAVDLAGPWEHIGEDNVGFLEI